MAEEKQAEEKKPVAKKTPQIDKWKKKKWFKIHASPEFDKRVIGETPAEKTKQLEGRKINASLGELTNQRQKRHITVKFRVKEIAGQDTFTELIGHEINTSYIGRMVNRRNSKMETVQSIPTKEDEKIKIKAVTISARKLEKDQETAIRKIMVSRIEKEVRKKAVGQVLQEIIFGVLAAKVFKDAKKIAPLKRVEITKSEIV